MKVFTTGQVAQICKVSPRTICKWFDSGRLRGYRNPGSQERRIPREYLIKFLKEHGMPLGNLETEMAKVLIVSRDDAWIKNVKQIIPDVGLLEFYFAQSQMLAGIDAENYDPDVVVIDYSSLGEEAPLLMDYLHGKNPGLILIAVLPEGEDAGPPDARDTYRHPFNLMQFAKQICTFVEEKKQTSS